MDTSDSAIIFDGNGVCDHCNTYDRDIKPNWKTDKEAEEKLWQSISRIKEDGSGRDFDCIIGMSGGADSSYLLYRVVKDFGLRPLVFHVDAGWNSQIAVNNIEKMIEGLGLDLFTEVINWEEMKDLQLAFFKSGVSHIDTPQDHAFFATMYKFAAKNKIKYILTGANYSTECVRNPLEWMYYQSDSFQLRDIHKQYGTKDLTTYPITNILWHKIYLPYIRGVRVVQPLNSIPYIKDQAMDFLVKEFGWEKYRQKHFESRFTRFYESYWLPTRFGYDVRRVQFSSLILTDQMTRSEAIDALELSPFEKSTIEADCLFVANKLNISVDELESYRTMPKRTFRDYNSQSGVYNVGATLRRLIGLERGGKR